MLKKIISIKNVGNFICYQSNGKVELSKTALIYGENGRGKTTLSVIFRSLGTNQAEYILGRRSLGISENETIVVSLQTDIGIVRFNSKDSGKWDKQFNNIEIFDSIFVNENVFSGDYVDIEHQRHLYSFVVGEESVERVKKIDALTQSINEINSRIREQEKIVKSLIKAGMNLENFLSLSNNPYAQIEMNEKTQEIQNFTNASEIVKHPVFSYISLPIVYQGDVRKKLAQTLDNVSTDAENMTLEHIRKISIPNGESWVRQGIEHTTDICPFCGQSIEFSGIIHAFRDYFDKAYIKLKNDISDSISLYEVTFSESKFRNIQETIFGNDTSFEFWKNLITIEKKPKIDKEILQETWDKFKSLLTAHFRKKLQSPLEYIEIGNDLEQIFRNYQDLLKEVEKYNSLFLDINNKIDELKKKITLIEENKLREEITLLQNQIGRYSIEGKLECEKYLNLHEEKSKLENDKQCERKLLDIETIKTFETYQEQINSHLENIGVNFRIIKTKPSFKGGKASSSYAIELNKILIELGSQDIDKPGFKNTLSDGDKNTLAFAFFLAKLDRDAKLSEKVIIFDDPVNSLDRSRKNYTIEQIEKISKLTKQVIVLSHDPFFLRELWGKFDRANTTSLCISRSGNGSKIGPWNIEKETDSDYVLNYRQLTEYLESGNNSAQNMRSVARCIRPTLEGYFRMKYPLDFGVKDWLGDFIKKARAASQDDNLYAMKKENIIDEIECISEFSAKYHHKQNLNLDTEPIDDSTLRSYINRTLKIIHR